MTEFKLEPDPALIGQAITIGEAVLDVAQPATIVSISPFKGQEKAVNAALLSATKLELPAVGLINAKENIRCMWAGQGQWFVTGDVNCHLLVEALIDKAAVTDQSDAWQVLTLTGVDAVDVMSRLCPLDLSTLAVGQTARTEFAHMMAAITPIENGVEIMIMRSFVKTALQDMRGAMERVSAQREL